MPNWSPEAYNSIGVVGIVVIVGLLLFLSLKNGWLVMGQYHREVVDGKNQVIDRLYERADKDAESINTLSKAITEKNATEDATTKILTALRETVAASGTRGGGDS